MSTHTEWTCKEFDIQQIMEMILNFWNTPEGKPHTAQLNPISFRAVQAGIKNSTNNTIDIHTIGGTINGYCHCPSGQGAFLNYIYSLTPEQRKATPTENYIRHARNKFGLNISLEHAEATLDEMGSKRVGSTLMNGVEGPDGKHYLVNSAQKPSVPNANIMEEGTNVPKKFVDKYTENNPNMSADGIWDLSHSYFNK